MLVKLATVPMRNTIAISPKRTAKTAMRETDQTGALYAAFSAYGRAEKMLRVKAAHSSAISSEILHFYYSISIGYIVAEREIRTPRYA